MTDQKHADLNLAIIGNCTQAALVDQRARIVWSCVPRFDGDPVLCSLLNGHSDGGLDGEFGFFDVLIDDFERDFPGGVPEYDFQARSRTYNPEAPPAVFEMRYSE